MKLKGRLRVPVREARSGTARPRLGGTATVIAEDGSLNEVDALVVTPSGVYLVEIKSHPGKMEGDAGTWVWFPPDGGRVTMDNPLLLADR